MSESKPREVITVWFPDRAVVVIDRTTGEQLDIFNRRNAEQDAARLQETCGDVKLEVWYAIPEHQMSKFKQWLKAEKS